MSSRDGARRTASHLVFTTRRGLPPVVRIAASSRRTQVLLLCDRRNYDRSIAGLATGQAQRYFASELGRLPVACSTLAGSKQSKSS